MDTVEFLRMVLPSQGVYYLADPIEAGRFRHTPTRDVAQLAAMAKVASREGKNIYFAVAGYEREAYVGPDGNLKRRTKDNAAWARSQWLDIDCGKQYGGSQRAALEDLFRFLGQTKLPRPTLIVNSGNGLHVYWVFDRDLPKAWWLKMAVIFKAIVKQFQLAQDDTTRTADIASVLRPIGTLNNKENKGLGVKDVKLIGAPGAVVPVVEWAARLMQLKEEQGLRVRDPILAAAPAAGQSMNNDLIAGTEYPESSAEIIAEHCAQIRWMRDMLGEGQSEPLWHACLGVLKHCTDGERFAHEWSQGHPGYEPGATQNKFDLWAYGPTTCEKFRLIGGDAAGRCASCPHKAMSPIQLGRVAPEQAKTVTVQQVVTVEDDDGELHEETQAVEVSIPPLPNNSRFDDYRYVAGKGLCVRATDANGVVSWPVICDQYLLAVGHFNDTSVTPNAWKMRVEAMPSPGAWETHDLSFKFVAAGGAQLASELGGVAGVLARPGCGKYLENYMKTWADQVRGSGAPTKMYHAQGWTDDGFVLGRRLLTAGAEPANIMLRKEAMQVADGLHVAGSRDRYVAVIDRLYNRKNHEAYQFAWLSAFGSVLLPLLAAEDGGVPLVGWSDKSGLGKTSVARAALGVWGNPNTKEGFVKAGMTTVMAFHAVAGLRHHLPLVLDEVTEWENEQIASFAYDYASGQGKIRLNQSGELRESAHMNWRNFVLVTSNKSLHDAIISTTPNAAPRLYRLWEFRYTTEYTDMLDPAEGDGLIAEMATNFGHLGPELLREILPAQRAVSKALREAVRYFNQRCGLDSDARFWARTAACVTVAGALTAKLGHHKFDLVALREWMVKTIDRMRAVAIDNLVDSANLFAEMLADLQSGFIVTMTEGNKRSLAAFPEGHYPPRGEVTGRVIVETKRLYLSMAAAKRWCSKRSVSITDMVDAAASRGWYGGASKYYVGRGTTIAVPQIRVYCINFSEWLPVVLASNNEDSEKTA